MGPANCLKETDRYFAEALRSGPPQQGWLGGGFSLYLLPAMSSDADKLLTGKPAETVRSAIQQASKMAERGAAWNDKTNGQKRN